MSAECFMCICDLIILFPRNTLVYSSTSILLLVFDVCCKMFSGWHVRIQDPGHLCSWDVYTVYSSLPSDCYQLVLWHVLF